MLLNTRINLDLAENLPKFTRASQVQLEPPLALPTMCYYFSTNTHTHPWLPGEVDLSCEQRRGDQLSQETDNSNHCYSIYLGLLLKTLKCHEKYTYFSVQMSILTTLYIYLSVQNNMSISTAKYILICAVQGNFCRDVWCCCQFYFLAWLQSQNQSVAQGNYSRDKPIKVSLNFPHQDLFARVISDFSMINRI